MCRLSQGLISNWYISNIKWVWPQMAGDSFGRFYVGTPGGFGGHDGGADGGEVFAFFNQTYLGDQILPAWQGYSFVPWWDDPETPEPCDGLDLRRQIDAPIAIDENGTLIVSARGRVFGLGPLLGDFDGNGCVNNFDIDPFVLALLYPMTWEAQYGAPNGVNLIGVADCNGDRLFNFFDIDCFIASVENPRCSPGYGGVQGCAAAPQPPQGFAAPQFGRNDAPAAYPYNDPSQWEHFWQMIDELRRQRRP